MSTIKDNTDQLSVDLTKKLATQAANINYDSIPESVRRIVRLCVVDYIGVTVAGATEPMSKILQEEFADGSGATVIGHKLAAPLLDAALINGTASHAQDYDDFHLSMPAHPTAAMMPAVFALAETEKASGKQLIEAFVAAYETACRIGLVVAPGHYGGGFHATGTVCALGAAAGCARLLNLDAEATAHAIGIAASQCSGLKASFGTMCKPLHAGRASYMGLFAARVAKRGFQGRTDIVECEQGFADAMSTDFHPEAGLADPKGGYHILDNVFKHHAACGATHSVIEAARTIVETNDVALANIKKITMRVDPKCDRICNILDPKTGLEAKFSLTQTAALALAGHKTSDPAVYNDELTCDASLTALRNLTTVDFLPIAADESCLKLYTELDVEMNDGTVFSESCDVAESDMSDELQQERVEEKFFVLCSGEISTSAAEKIVELSRSLDSLPNILELAGCCVPE